MFHGVLSFKKTGVGFGNPMEPFLPVESLKYIFSNDFNFEPCGEFLSVFSFQSSVFS